MSLKEIIDEINLLRKDPKGYAEKIRKYKGYFKGNVLRVPGKNVGVKTQEGPAAYEEAAKFLDDTKPVFELKPSKGLMKIAEEFKNEVLKVEFEKIGDIDMDKIIDNSGSYSGNFSRAMEFGGSTPEEAIINLVVSDGDVSRGQRDSLLAENVKLVGVANGKHETYRFCTVIVACTKFENKDGDDTVTF